MTVTIWNEFIHEKEQSACGDVCRKHYPNGIHEYLKEALSARDNTITYQTAYQSQPECGLSDEVLEKTDVLVWWAHVAHNDIPDELVEKIRLRILGGMGLIVLHSGHYSKIFARMLGTSCGLRWREVGEKERVWTVAPGHPIARGIPESFEIPHTEMYGEPFDIANDGKVVFMSWYEGGNVFRSGVAFERDLGRIFYFSPGHETFPIYHNENVQKVILNAIKWAQPQAPVISTKRVSTNDAPLEKIYTTDDTAKGGVQQ